MIETIADELKAIADETLGPYLEDRSAVGRSRKIGGEVVSEIDVALELKLRRLLKGRYPSARIVGEESANAAEAAGTGLDDDDIWLVDPVDGTGNFLAGKDDFAVMLCLLKGGRAAASWIYLPCKQLMAVAQAGSGAFLNDERLMASGEAKAPPEMSGEVHAGFLPEGLKARVSAAQGQQPACRPRYCAGATYVGLAQGECDYALYYRTRPWDHAPGALLIREAGGRADRFDGSPYRAGDGLSGLLVTASAQSWDGLKTWLLGSVS